MKLRMLNVCAVIVCLAAGTPLYAGDADQVQKYIDDLKSGPAVYYTPEAAAYFATLGSYGVSGLSVNKDAAVRTFAATIKLGGMQLGGAREVVPVLIDIFPKAVHVVDIRQARYAGEGTFEDCVSTYVMSAKNQFMLACPFLDYNSLSLCEGFVEGPYETEMLDKHVGSGGVIKDAMFNLKITFTFYAGECALSRLTGMSLGHDPGAWRQWWLTSTAVAATPAPYTVASPSPYTYTVPVASQGQNLVAVPKNTYSDIAAGGKYRVFLTTGDDLTGTVESRDDTSMVLETLDGKPYAFKFSLMQSYQVIEQPKPKPAQQSSGAEIVSYDELRQRASANPALEVKIANGSVFKGRLLAISDDELQMDVEGSTIKILKDVVKQIIFLPALPKQTADQQPPAPSKPAGPFDTLWSKNPQTDKYGNRLPDVSAVGTIVDEGDNFVSLQGASGGAAQKFPRDQITRIVRHSADNGDDAIRRYAKPLACPGDMVMVDMPPGRKGKPFFKVCVDRYEYPNKSGNVPRSNLSFDDAKKLCEQQGKRPCTSEEWMWACGGPDGNPYPYGKTFEQDRCNNDTRLIETSGNRINCSSPFGGFDMVGNVFEWVTTKDGGMALMGGPFSKCQTVSPSPSGASSPQSGLRCCRSN